MCSRIWIMVLLCVAIPFTGAEAASRNNGAAQMRQIQQMQMKMMQARMQQMQAMQQAKATQRQQRLQMVREAAQRERDRKEAALHKSDGGSTKQLGADKKDDKPETELASGAGQLGKDPKKAGNKPVAASDKPAKKK